MKDRVMEKTFPVNNLAVVGGVFAAIFLGMYAIEVVQPAGKKAEATAKPVPAARPEPPPPPPPPEQATQKPDLEIKEREIKSEIERLKFDLEGHRRDFDVAERRVRENQERFDRAGLELKSRLLGEGVRLRNESLRVGNKVRDTEHRIRMKQRELEELYKNAQR